MKYRKLGFSDIELSVICLGTMTWGTQNTEAEAHSQLDHALERGVNFIDTAELYPSPPQKELHGRTESYIGSWLASDKSRRAKVFLATKVVGPGEFVKYVRNGPKLNKEHIQRALEESLKRLQTDYIDLYQLHWPERKTNFFGKLGYSPAGGIRGVKEEAEAVPIEESLSVLADLKEAGKIHHIGVSNETPWGVHRFLSVSQEKGWPRVASIQNPYNLLNRSFEVGLAEMAYREKVGLLAYSPLGFGLLSGKYLGGGRPSGARLTIHSKKYSRYTNEASIKAAESYVGIAKKHGLDPAQMALAFVNSRPFLTSNIIGATNLEQLEANIKSVDLELSPEILKEIELAHTRYPNPAP